ncbi:protein involved in plasmid replication-relaxation [Ureibacillus xyleni]|uniref:Protein involved in plasmid replication-relaxation n=1 Tax=Ureibacillus xyleni TaxID=614648 RepID=A0A285SWT4_9BACL|nr:protein involved in plasmid replication-relaxation [Ureibacillus xyleni]
MLLLERFDYLTRDQLRQYFKLGKVRNTNRILNNLSEYLMTTKEGHDTVYYLSKFGRYYVGSETVRKKGNHILHSIIRNQFWLFYNCPNDWKSEVEFLDSNNRMFLRCDASFTRNGFKCYLEVDNTQTMKENKDKIKRYKILIESFEKQYGYYPTLIWVTRTELRRKQLEQVCEGLKVKVYTVDDIK